MKSQDLPTSVILLLLPLRQFERYRDTKKSIGFSNNGKVGERAKMCKFWTIFIFFSLSMENHFSENDSLTYNRYFGPVILAIWHKSYRLNWSSIVPYAFKGKSAKNREKWRWRYVKKEKTILKDYILSFILDDYLGYKRGII